MGVIIIKNLPFIIFGGIIIILGVAVTLSSGNYKGSQKYIDSYLQSINFDNTKVLTGEEIKTINIDNDAKVIIWIENGESIKLSFMEKSFNNWNNIDTKGVENNSTTYVNFNSVSKKYDKLGVLISVIKNNNESFNKAVLNDNKNMNIVRFKDYTIIYSCEDIENFDKKPEIKLYNGDNIVKELNEQKYIKE
ncbi:hypothetical protein HMPREF1092_03020 [Clostridium thermobutyricum]|uniref:Uncharacterized protein n=1 Tax=Clostridium thermobutyricum TaxID=29372 RepID=N9XVB3_9CLOT|nr:hypothetical protein HMPREF1092_03020 [Clostridium thermobutyricum]